MQMAAPIAKSDAERRKIIQDVEDLKQAKGYISIDQACSDLGISRDVYYSYRRNLKDSSNEPDQTSHAPAGQLARTTPAQEIHLEPAKAPARISVSISQENYDKLRIIAIRKAMTISSICANILDDGIKKLE